MSFLLAVLGAAVVVRTWMSVIRALVIPRQSRWTRRVEWRRIDLDELLP